MKEVFEPEPRPKVMKTNIQKIAKLVSRRITEYGYNVFVSLSRKSESRYLEVRLSKTRKITIRISDHPADKLNKFEFDIHTLTRRKGSLDYLEMLDAFKQIVREKRRDAEIINPENSGKE
jgi:hypothetical protein